MPAGTARGSPAAPGRGVGVFLDRDGTVIHDRHYLSDPDGVELLPTAGTAIARLNAAGIPVLLVTNQSGIGRGLFSEAQFQAVQQRMCELLAGHGAKLDGVYHCPHAPDRNPPCECRKPGPGLFRRAARDHGLDPARCFYIGDRARDLAPAARSGGTPILVLSGSKIEPEQEALPPGSRVVDTLEDAARLVLAACARD